jgi:hypothetical protein
MHLEGRQAIGFLLEAHRADLLRPILGLDLQLHLIDAGRLGLLLEEVIEAAGIVDRDIAPPFGVVRAGDDDSRRRLLEGEHASRVVPDIAFDMNRLFRPVDRPLGEDVDEIGIGLGAAVEILLRPLQPGIAAGLPVVVGVEIRPARRIEHQRVAVLGDDDAADIDRIAALPRRAPFNLAGAVGPAAEGLNPVLSSLAFDRDLRALHRLSGRE